MWVICLRLYNNKSCRLEASVFFIQQENYHLTSSFPSQGSARMVALFASFSLAYVANQSTNAIESCDPGLSCFWIDYAYFEILDRQKYRLSAFRNRFLVLCHLLEHREIFRHLHWLVFVSTGIHSTTPTLKRPKLFWSRTVWTLRTERAHKDGRVQCSSKRCAYHLPLKPNLRIHKIPKVLTKISFAGILCF